MFWDIFIPSIALLVGLVGGFFIGIYYFKKQMERMQNDPAMMTKMAKQMGYNLNRQQMNSMQKMMNKKQKKR